MRLQLITGCISDSLTVDGKEEIDLTDAERQQTIGKIADWLKQHPENLNCILQDLIPEQGEGESEGGGEPCKCCGDIVYTYTWDI